MWGEGSYRFRKESRKDLMAVTLSEDLQEKETVQILGKERTLETSSVQSLSRVRLFAIP